MNITYPAVENYIKNVLPSHDRVIRDMEKYAAEHRFPIIGPMVGPFLRQLAYATGSRRILELGSGFGYSACWFAGGLKNGGRVICTDGSAENHRRARRYFKRAGIENIIDYRVGDALEILSGLRGQFDIILNDIDKIDYPKAFDMAIPRLKKGGLFITDNVLWSGRILEKEPDTTSQAILEFNRKLVTSKDVIASIIPIRDGLGIAVKL